jgi:hypothetical protein
MLIDGVAEQVHTYYLKVTHRCSIGGASMIQKCAPVCLLLAADQR